MFRRLLVLVFVLTVVFAGAVAGIPQAADPQLQASIVKDLGAVFEQELPEIARELFAHQPDGPLANQGFYAVLAQSVMNAPSYSLRGGTREILRGIISRGLGLR